MNITGGTQSLYNYEMGNNLSSGEEVVNDRYVFSAMLQQQKCCF